MTESSSKFRPSSHTALVTGEESKDSFIIILRDECLSEVGRGSEDPPTVGSVVKSEKQETKLKHSV